jgi:EcsC protein family
MIAAQEIATPLSRAHHQALARAVDTLENPNFAARIADYAGAPVNRVVQLLPRRAGRGLSRAVEAAIQKCLKTAISSLAPAPNPPATWLSTAIAGFTGGVSGFFGMPALIVELPLTTTIMLRAIADIARHHGEDLNTLEARLACLQVFALGARGTAVRSDLGYFAARALMTRLTGNAAAHVVERGAAELSGVMLNGLVAEIVSRFSIVVSDRVAAKRASGRRRGRRRHRQRDLHESFSAGCAGTFHRPSARARVWRRNGAPALCRTRRAEPEGPQMKRRPPRRS